MESVRDCLEEYRKRVRPGSAIPRAYRAILDYMAGLRTHFENGFPDHFVSSRLYQGYMDVTFFTVVSEQLGQRSLKVAVVFLHETFQFEAWLAGSNKSVQKRFLKLFEQAQWDKYPGVETMEGADAILRHVLAGTPDFCDPASLNRQIETRTFQFIEDIASFLSARES